MHKQQPLWHRLYFDAAYTEIARLIGYKGTTYREMLKMLEPLEEKFGKQRVHSALYHLVTFEGQMTCNPKPLAEVKFRPEIRHLCWQLLGPPPEKEDEFYRTADGTPWRPGGATEAADRQQEAPEEKKEPEKTKPEKKRKKR